MMRHLRPLGLAAMAAMALMAFGASTASATTLFTDAAKTIPYTAGTTIHWTLASGTSLTIENTSTQPIATCSGGTEHETTANTSGATVSTSGFGGASGCSQTTDVVANGSYDIAFSSGSNGTVTGTGNQVTYGIFGVSCTYGTGEGTTLGTLDGGSGAKMTINAVINKTAGGFLCPSTIRVTAQWVLTSPHALYVGA